MEPEPRERWKSLRMKIKRWLIMLFILIGAGYLGVCLMLAFFQRKLIYAPRKASVALAESGFEEGRIRDVFLSVAEGVELRGWYCQTDPNLDQSSAKLAILFPGNAGNRLNRVRLLSLLNELGCDVLIFDYRGYGGSDGQPSEAAITADSRKVWEFAREELGFDREKIIVFGQSLGGGVATRLVWELCQTEEQPAGLVLQATFTSMVDAAKMHYPWLPVNALLVDRYPSVNLIPEITCPILVIHGVPDEVVPYELGQRLFEAAPAESSNGIKKKFVDLPGAGHNNIYHVALDEVRQAKLEFLEEIDRVASERD